MGIDTWPGKLIDFYKKHFRVRLCFHLGTVVDSGTRDQEAFVRNCFARFANEKYYLFWFDFNLIVLLKIFRASKSDLPLMFFFVRPQVVFHFGYCFI